MPDRPAGIRGRLGVRQPGGDMFVATRTCHSLLSVLPLEKLRGPETFHFRGLRDRETTARMKDATGDASWRPTSRAVVSSRSVAPAVISWRRLARCGAFSSRMRIK